MWLVNDFPAEQVKARYGFAPDQAWLDHLRLSAIRLAGGCSASLVSSHGLVLTNHHCVRDCVKDLSSAKADYLEHGFVARTPAEEKRCAAMEANQLVEIRDVTDEVHQATAGKEQAAFNDALKAVRARLESACASSAQLRCDLVTLFHGGKYHLYKYRRYQDLRLAFAPEFPMAAFGGYPDNFNFPRYGFDGALLRIYDGGAPLATPEHLRFSTEGAKEGDLVFVAGNPGGTERVQTVPQLAFQRDVVLPNRIAYLSELRGLMLLFQKGSADLFRVTRAPLRSVENELKSLRGRHAYLADPALFAGKEAEDRELREKVEADPKLEARFGGAWQGIAAATQAHRRIYTRYRLLEKGEGFETELFDHALDLLRAADERSKPDAIRLAEYTTAQLPSVEQRLADDAPINKPLETLKLGFSLRRLQETLGADDPLTKSILGNRAPEELARELVEKTQLADPKVRMAIYKGARPGGDDPMLAVARLVDGPAREVRKEYEELVDAPLKQNGKLLSQAYVAVHGTSGYPDATFTLRISYGQVKGWQEDGVAVPAATTLAGLFARQTGKFPFAISAKWLAARGKLKLDTPMDLATTHDIIGGNSGSPMVDRKGELVGLIFDGNLWSLGNRYGFLPDKSRAVALDARVFLEVMEKVFGATRLVDEIKAP